MCCVDCCLLGFRNTYNHVRRCENIIGEHGCHRRFISHGERQFCISHIALIAATVCSTHLAALNIHIGTGSEVTDLVFSICSGIIGISLVFILVEDRTV